jgi:hypothetical protein
MQVNPKVLAPVVPPVTDISGRVGLLLCRDLIFIAKVKGTAEALGYALVIADDLLQATTLVKQYRPQVVFVDLTAFEMASRNALSAYRELGDSNARFVAFGPHVEVNLLAEAKASGYCVVLPRSRFSAELPELMRCYFGQARTDER